MTVARVTGLGRLAAVAVASHPSTAAATDVECEPTFTVASRPTSDDA